MSVLHLASPVADEYDAVDGFVADRACDIANETSELFTDPGNYLLESTHEVLDSGTGCAAGVKGATDTFEPFAASANAVPYGGEVFDVAVPAIGCFSGGYSEMNYNFNPYE